MNYNKQEKKMTYEMKSVGDAWMDHVEKHHNTSAITPAYLSDHNQQNNSENISKSQTKKMPDLYHEAMKDKGCKKDVKEIKKEIEIDREK